MIRGAIFDIDGTLLDSMPIWMDCGSRYLAKLGIQAENNLGEILFEMSLEQGGAYLKKQYGLTQSEEEIITLVLKEVEDFYRYEADLKPGVKNLLQNLFQKNIPMALATTGKKELAQAALQRLGVWPYFQVLLGTSELSTSKSEPKIYFQACQALKTSPEETAVFEDALYALKTAKAAGFYCVGVYDQASKAQQKQLQKMADLYLENFEQEICLSL